MPVLKEYISPPLPQPTTSSASGDNSPSITYGPYWNITTIEKTKRTFRTEISMQHSHAWVLARRSRIPSRAWNRESIQILADFQGLGDVDEFQGQDSAHKEYSGYVYDKALPETPYHVFTLAKKKQLVYIVSLARLFSRLSSNIYFPALGQIATDLKIDIALVSLTITVYMIVQGIVPSFWGPLSDTIGRRPVFVGTFLVYLAAKIGPAFSNSFAALLLFRGLQAGGSAATISIGAGVIGDITTSRERGGLIGIFGGIRMMGQLVGPVFGGIINQFFGFRAIFWFLLILGTFPLLLIILLLPETLRSIAGNGTIRLNGFQRPLLYIFKPQPSVLSELSPNLPPRKVRFASIVASLRFLFEKDVFVTLFFGSIVYTVWSMVTSSTTALFQARFSLNNLQLGLVFLPNDAGCVAGSYLTGYLMDRDYRITETRYRKINEIADGVKLDGKTAEFPIETARLRNIWWIILIFVVSTTAYGFSLSLSILVVPLVLQFFIAYTATAPVSWRLLPLPDPTSEPLLLALSPSVSSPEPNSALVIDLYPGAAASATTVNNLVRCSVGALGVAFVQLVIDRIGVGITFLLFAGVTAALSSLFVLEWFYGQHWRQARSERLNSEREVEGNGKKKSVGK